MNDETYDVLKRITSGKSRFESAIKQFGHEVRRLVREGQTVEEINIRTEECEQRLITHLGPLFERDLES